MVDAKVCVPEHSRNVTDVGVVSVSIRLCGPGVGRGVREISGRHGCLSDIAY